MTRTLLIAGLLFSSLAFAADAACFTADDEGNLTPFPQHTSQRECESHLGVWRKTGKRCYVASENGLVVEGGHLDSESKCSRAGGTWSDLRLKAKGN